MSRLNLTPKDFPIRVNQAQAKLLREKTGCSLHDSITALDVRDGIMEFAEEYLERRDLAAVMSVEGRFPRWFQYLDQKKRV